MSNPYLFILRYPKKQPSQVRHKLNAKKTQNKINIINTMKIQNIKYYTLIVVG